MQSIEKAERIAEVMCNSALTTIRHAVELHKYARKRPRISSKRINNKNRMFFKRKIGTLTAMMSINAITGAMQMATILSQPTPKFKPGTLNNEQATQIDNTDNQISESE